MPPKRTSNMVEGKLWFCTCCFWQVPWNDGPLAGGNPVKFRIREMAGACDPSNKSTDIIIMIFRLSMVQKSGDHHLGCINPDNNGINLYIYSYQPSAGLQPSTGMRRFFGTNRSPYRVFFNFPVSLQDFPLEKLTLKCCELSSDGRQLATENAPKQQNARPNKPLALEMMVFESIREKQEGPLIYCRFIVNFIAHKTLQ